MGGTYPVLADSAGEVLAAYRVPGAPALYEVDAAGRIERLVLGRPAVVQPLELGEEGVGSAGGAADCGEVSPPLREFFVSDSGYVQPREGLGLGWVAGALAVLAALFHPQAAEASDPCEGIPHGQCAWICTTEQCQWDPPKDLYWRRYYCRQANGMGCELVTSACTCK